MKRVNEGGGDTRLMASASSNKVLAALGASNGILSPMGTADGKKDGIKRSGNLFTVKRNSSVNPHDSVSIYN